MSKLESKISELERELALKKGFQAVRFVLPKNLPDDVSTEIQSKLREIADSLALSKEQITGDNVSAISAFTEQELSTLKMLAATVLNRANGNGAGGSGIAVVTNPVTGEPYVPPVQKSYGTPKKAKILTAENVRGEGRKFAAPDDEIYIANPEKVDDHGMVSATHMKRGIMLKIPLDDLAFLE